MWHHQNSILTTLLSVFKIPVTAHENIFSSTSTAQVSNIFLAQFMYRADILHNSWTGIRGARFMNSAISQIGRIIYNYWLIDVFCQLLFIHSVSSVLQMSISNLKTPVLLLLMICGASTTIHVYEFRAPGKCNPRSTFDEQFLMTTHTMKTRVNCVLACINDNKCR